MEPVHGFFVRQFLALAVPHLVVATVIDFLFDLAIGILEGGDSLEMFECRRHLLPHHIPVFVGVLNGLLLLIEVLHQVFCHSKELLHVCL